MRLHSTTFWCFLGLISLFVACEKDIGKAKNSLNGTWVVVKTYQETGNENADIRTGVLGSFTFNENEAVSYHYELNNTPFSGSENWTLTRELVNSRSLQSPFHFWFPEGFHVKI